MYNCPECQQQMIHSNDIQIENGQTHSNYYCNDCRIELLKYWEE